MVQTPYSPFQDFSVAARISISTGSVVSLLFDNTEEDLNTLIKRLRWRCTQTRQSPLSLLAILFEGYGYTSEEYRRLLDAEVVSLEVRTGMTALDTNQGSNGGYTLRIADYEKMMRDLHSCNTNLIFLANVLNFEMEFGAFCGRIFDVFEELRERVEGGKFHTERARDEFQRHLAYCVDSGRFRQKQTQSLRMRVKSQINVVSLFSSFFSPLLLSFSLLSPPLANIQKSTFYFKINMTGCRNIPSPLLPLLTTTTKQMYSLISQRDMRNNIIIAKDSQDIAEAAQQDSRTMKTIALMTLIFLPGTLVAVSLPLPFPSFSLLYPNLTWHHNVTNQVHIDDEK